MKYPKMGTRQLYLLEERIKTFKNWPFDEKSRCNIRNMAEAGFYSVATSTEDVDATKCFLCGKELDGWESFDDPWAEHRSHAAKCAFVQIGKNEDELSFSEFLSIVKQYMINEVNQIGGQQKEIIDEKLKAIKRKYRGRK
ncbi:hypothetical protein ACJJTC_000255 [Scirpophaga incertulas]